MVCYFRKIKFLVARAFSDEGGLMGHQAKCLLLKVSSTMQLRWNIMKIKGNSWVKGMVHVQQ